MEQGHLHNSGHNLITVGLPRLDVLKLSNLAVVGVVEAARQVVLVRAGGAYDGRVYSASDLYLSFIIESVPTRLRLHCGCFPELQEPHDPGC